MKNFNIWQDYKFKNNFSTLNKNINVDVLIIGGGITGINTAYYLKETNLKVCLVEKNTLCSGITSKTTAKLTYLQENIYSTLSKYFNKDIAIYIDDAKKEHIVYNLCPHLKCGLLLNELELTWDCPCHGSRFTIDGKCITGPSNYDITYKE